MCLEILDEDEVYDLGQDMLASDELSQIIAFNDEVVKKTAINLYFYLISKGWYRRAERIEKKIDELLTEWDMEEKISLHIFKKFLKYKKFSMFLYLSAKDIVDASMFVYCELT